MQRGQFALYPPGEAREDWKILRAFSGYVDKTLPYDDLESLRRHLAQVNPVFDRLDMLPRFGCSDLAGPAGGTPGEAGFAPVIANYYQTDPISRASPTMANCTATILQGAAPALQAAE